MSTPTPKQPRKKSPAKPPVRDGGAMESASDARRAELGVQDAARLNTQQRTQAFVDSITDESGDINAEKLRAALEEAARHESEADEAVRSGIEAEEPRLRAHLAQLQAQREEIETKEANRAGASALAVEVVVTGCEFATTHFPDPATGRTLPTFTMNHPCVLPGFQKKDQPDNDCRLCIHHTRQLVPVPIHQKRYPRSGMVIPITSEQDADALTYFLKATGMLQLRAVDSEIHFVKQALDRLAATREELQRREAERVRRGPQFR